MAKGDQMVGIVDRNGKGDKRRPLLVESEQFNENGAQTFGADWLVPPVLRRRRNQEEDNRDAS